MSLLSKLLGQAGEKLVKEMAEAAGKAAVDRTKEQAAQTVKPDTWSPAPAAAPVPEALGPSGDSWGPVMPAEECQFNYGGSFEAYFDHVFREDLPAYRVAKERVSEKTIVYTLYDGAREALVVEVLPQSTARQKLRRDCLRAGIPYLRFYHNHDGWWNTRSYVVRRCRQAMGI